MSKKQYNTWSYLHASSLQYKEKCRSFGCWLWFMRGLVAVAFNTSVHQLWILYILIFSCVISNHLKTPSNYLLSLPVRPSISVKTLSQSLAAPCSSFTDHYFDCLQPLTYIARPHFRFLYTLLPVHRTQYRHLHSRQAHPHPSKQKHPQKPWTDPCRWGRRGKPGNRLLPALKSRVMQVGHLPVWLKGWTHLGPSPEGCWRSGLAWSRAPQWWGRRRVDRREQRRPVQKRSVTRKDPW